jgi:hypothetical protein
VDPEKGGETSNTVVSAAKESRNVSTYFKLVEYLC